MSAVFEHTYLLIVNKVHAAAATCAIHHYHNQSIPPMSDCCNTLVLSQSYHNQALPVQVQGVLLGRRWTPPWTPPSATHPPGLPSQP